MKINKFVKNLAVTSLCFGSLMLLGTSQSHAVLQANGDTGTTYNLSDWIMNVRQMEQLGGAMGLSESIDTTNLTSSSDSNNIDVHMEKNTEYGALAILSASSYGNPNKINDGETTTGNVTGVVMKTTWEWMAAGNISAVNAAAGRYRNTYSTTYTQKPGDAITETKGWHDSTSSIWMTSDGDTGIIRGFGSIFSYNGNAGLSQNGGWHYEGPAYFTFSWYSRAVVVSGQDF